MTGKVLALPQIAPAIPPVEGQLVRAAEVKKRGKHVGRLETVTDWRRQLGKIFREMRRGELPHEDGTKLTYVARVGADLARIEQELREAEALREELKNLQPVLE